MSAVRGKRKKATQNPEYDASYRELFSSPVMIRELLSIVLKEELTGRWTWGSWSVRRPPLSWRTEPSARVIWCGGCGAAGRLTHTSRRSSIYC